MNKVDIDFAEGQINPGSIADEVYVAFQSEIIEFPAIIDNFEPTGNIALNKIVNMVGSFKMATVDNYFIKLYNTQGQGNLSYETVGEADGKLFKNKLECKFPKITDKIRAFAKYTANTKCIYVVKHAGNFYVLGNPDYPVVTTTLGDTGKNAEDAHGITINVEATDTTPLPKYLGILMVRGGYISCDTGALTMSVYHGLTVSHNVVFMASTSNTGQTNRVTVHGDDLSADLTVEIEGDSEFTKDLSSITSSQAKASGGKDINITYTPTASGSHSAVLHITSVTDDIDISIPLLGSCAS